MRGELARLPEYYLKESRYLPLVGENIVPYKRAYPVYRNEDLNLYVHFESIYAVRTNMCIRLIIGS